MVRSSARCHAWPTRLLRVVVLLLVVAPVSSDGRVAAQGAAEPIDLAAMALQPGDLEEEGLTDHGIDNAVLTPRSQAAGAFLWRYRLDEDDRGAEALEEADPDLAYILDLVRLQQPDEAGGGIVQRVISYVFAFDDEETAEDGFDQLASAWVTDAMDEEETDAEPGDEQVLVAGTGRDSVTNARFERMDLLFRLDAIVAGVSVETFGLYDGEPVEQEQVEALAERQAERIEQVLDDGAPGLSTRMVRLNVPGENGVADAYTVRDGESLRSASETLAAFERAQEIADDAGMTDQYRFEQMVLGDATTSETPLSFYSGRLTQLEDDDAASEYMAAAVDRLWASGVEELEEAEDIPTLGDEAAAFTYQHTRSDGIQFNDYRIYVRVGDEVFTLALVTTEEPDIEAINDLAELQVECLTGEEDCLDPVRVPAGLR